LAAPEREALPGRSAPSFDEEEPLDQEEPEGLLLVPSGVPPSGDTVVTVLFEMKAVPALIRQLVPSGLCPAPPVSLVLKALTDGGA
jgi:hypothetical protein